MIDGIAFYRVSSKQQAEGFSLSAQENNGISYATQNGIKIVKRWQVAESAKNAGRKEFDDFLEYARKNANVKVLLSATIDRSLRNLFDLGKLEVLVKENEKELHFFRDNFVFKKGASVGHFYQFAFQGVVSTGFAYDLSEKTKAGMIEKALQGQYPGIAPFGYKNNPLTHQIELDSQEAIWVIKAYELYATRNYSLKSLREKLIQLGFPKPKFKFYGSAVTRILSNPIYYGWFTWQKKLYKGTHKPLISKSLADEVQAIMHRSNKTHTKRAFTYSGMMKCYFCACAITAETQKKYVYYHCTKNHGPCPNGFVREEIIEQEVIKILDGFKIEIESLQLAAKDLEQKAGEYAAVRESRMAILTQELEHANTRMNMAYDDKLDGKITESFWLNKNREFEKEIANLKEQLREVESRDPNTYALTANNLIELAKQMKNQFKGMTPERKRNLLNLVCSNLQLKHKSLSFSYTKSFDLLAESLKI